jgi:hypothetical protein
MATPHDVTKPRIGVGPAAAACKQQSAKCQKNGECYANVCKKFGKKKCW